jgi:ribosomal protein S18 acetylase RimI-like enzyme
MLINIKTRINEGEILELIESSLFSDPDQLDKEIEDYIKDDSLEFYGLEAEGAIAGIIGFRMDADKQLTITHLAVKPEFRGAGFGRGLALEAIDLMEPALLAAEADEASVDFFRNIGFEIESLGEDASGLEKFKCTYHTELVT